MNVNLAVIGGRLTDAPNTRFTPSGKQVANFSVAVNEGYGEKKITEYVDCEAWESQAKRIEHATKGTTVIVQGSITTQKWEKNGQKMRKTFVKARMVDALVDQSSTPITAALDVDDIPF